MAQLLCNFSPDALQLTLQMLTYDPDRRITARTALESPYFHSMPAQLVIPPTVTPLKNTTNNDNTSNAQ